MNIFSKKNRIKNNSSDSQPPAYYCVVLVLAMLLAWPGGVNLAVADVLDTGFTFSLERQPLAVSLKEVAKVTNLQLIFSSRTVAGKFAPPVKGVFTLHQVMEKLLTENRLTYVFDGEDVIAIKPLPASPIKQKSEADARVAKQDYFVLEEVMVAARKREENLQDIPLSVTSFSIQDMALKQLDRMDRIGGYTPNLQFTALAPSSGHNASSSVFIRGIGQTDFIPATDPGVGLYVDGIYYARSVGSMFDIIDIERIEVLRGPQGTLFGKNTIGGAISVYSRGPESHLGGRLKLTVASDHGRELLASVDLPYSSTVRSRFTFSAKQRDGYVTRLSDGRDLGDDNSLSLRASIDWAVFDQLDVEFKADYNRENENGSPQVFNEITTDARLPLLASINSGCPGVEDASTVPENSDPRCANNQYQSLGYYHVASNGPLTSELEVFGTVLKVDWNFGWAQFESVTGYRNTDWLSARDADNTPLTILHTRNDEQQEQYSQEFRLNNHFQQRPLQWLLGVYYFREKAVEDYPVILPQPQVGINNTRVNVGSESQAIFGQLSYQIGEHITLTTGLRFTRELKEAKPFNGADPLGPGYSVPNPLSSNPSCAPEAKADDCIRLKPGEFLFNPILNEKVIDEISPMVNLSYRWSSNLMSYLSYSEGFKSGGFSTRIIAPVISEQSPTGREFLPEYDPEFVSTWEVGIKMAMMDERIMLNLALFQSQYDDIQIVSRVGVAPILVNAGTADIRGLELEWRYAPTHNIFINGGIGVLDAEYKKLSEELLSQGEEPGALGVVDLDDQLANTPEISASMGVAYAMATKYGTITTHADVTYQSRVYFDAPNTRQISQPGYTLVNAGIIFKSPDSAWRASLSLRNLTDKTYRIAGNSSLHASSGYAESAYVRPDDWSFSLEYRF